MTREEAKIWAAIPRDKLAVIAPHLEKHFETLCAFAGGEAIEAKAASKWFDEEAPGFYSNWEYRVKPAKEAQAACAPKPFYYISKDGGVFFDACSTCSPTQFLFGNCFKTQEEAFAALDRVRAALKGEESVVKKDLTTAENSSVVASEEERREQRETNENEFRFDGKTYVAIESEKNKRCNGCAFWEEYCMQLQLRGKIPRCYKEFRADGKNVHFVEKGNRSKTAKKL